MRRIAPLLLALAVLLAPAPAGALEQTVPLGAGYSFVALHVTPAAPVDSASLLAAGKAERVFRFDPGTQSFHYQLKLDGGQLFGAPFDLRPGEGYAIQCREPAGFTVTGDAHAGIPLASLSPGYNFVGLPAHHGTGARALLAGNPQLAALFRWIDADQAFGFVLRLPDGSLFGTDFTLETGRGYFARVTGDFTLHAEPAFATVRKGTLFDLAAVKVVARFTDGTAVDVSDQARFVPSTGTLSGGRYAAPAHPTTVAFAITLPGHETKRCQFTLAVVDAGATPVVTTDFRCAYALAPRATVVDEETTRTLAATATTLSLALPSGAAGPSAGDILIGYHGDGYLRRVVAATVTDGVASVSTEGASLEQAFESLDYAYRGKLSTLHEADGAAAGSPESRAVKRFLRSRTVAPALGPERGILPRESLRKILDHASVSVALTKANVSFDPTLEFDILIEWFSLKRFLFVVGGDMNFGMEFRVEVTATTGELNAEIELYRSQPYLFAIGPVPASFEWDIACGVDASASVTGAYTYGNDWTYAVRMGAEYDGSAWRQIKSFERTSAARDDYELNGELEIKPYFKLGFALKVCGLAGPKMHLITFLRFRTEMPTAGRIDLTVAVGVEARVSFIVQVFSYTLAEYDETIFTYDWEIYARTIDFTVAAPTVSPPGGSYDAPQTVTLACATAGAAIRYTTDGTDPGPARGILYAGPIQVAASIDLKAVAYKSERIVSAIVAARYLIAGSALQVVAPQAHFRVSCTVHGSSGCTVHEKDSSVECANDVNLSGYSGAETAIIVPAAYTAPNGRAHAVRFVSLTEAGTLRSIRFSEGIREIYMPGAQVVSVRLPSTARAFNFYGCGNLADVTLDEGIPEIPEVAFHYCQALHQLTLPSSVKAIGRKAFAKTPAAMVITSPIESLGEEAFSESGLVSIVLGSPLREIPPRCFTLCSALTAVTLPEGLETIGEEAFWATALQSVALPATVTAVGKRAFADNPALRTVVWSPGATTVTEETFRNDHHLTISGLGAVETVQSAAFELLSWQEAYTQRLDFGDAIDRLDAGALGWGQSLVLFELHFAGKAPSVHEGLKRVRGKVRYHSGAAGWAEVIASVGAVNPDLAFEAY